MLLFIYKVIVLLFKIEYLIKWDYKFMSNQKDTFDIAVVNYMYELTPVCVYKMKLLLHLEAISNIMTKI